MMFASVILVSLVLSRDALKGLLTNNISSSTGVPVRYVDEALDRGYMRWANLTQHQCAAIYIFSVDSPCYRLVNIALRTLNETALKPWVAYLKLLHEGVDLISPEKIELCRGDSYDLYLSHDKNSIVYLPSLSYSVKPEICEMFSGFPREDCTILKVKAMSARDIRPYSTFGGTEGEYIILPGAKVKIVDIIQRTNTACRTVVVEELPFQSSHSIDVTNLGNQISPEQDKYYDNFMRSYYKRAILTRLNVRSLDISVIGGSDNQLLSWPIILSVSGKVPVTSTQLVGRILIGIDEHATRGLTAKEIKTLLKNTKANAVGQWISIYTIDADFP
ncbi:unnamed protein product [Adineta ricciae]|uniref:Uncharacterized protein n=1 Tax=Adineta ricciae TaxID=249248 RepID=A0A815V851_ADIRI|nr:unnamed protein product [Adineta ricciae]